MFDKNSFFIKYIKIVYWFLYFTGVFPYNWNKKSQIFYPTSSLYQKWSTILCVINICGSIRAFIHLNNQVLRRLMNNSTFDYALMLTQVGSFYTVIFLFIINSVAWRQSTLRMLNNAMSLWRKILSKNKNRLINEKHLRVCLTMFSINLIIIMMISLFTTWGGARNKEPIWMLVINGVFAMMHFNLYLLPTGILLVSSFYSTHLIEMISNKFEYCLIPQNNYAFLKKLTKNYLNVLTFMQLMMRILQQSLLIVCFSIFLGILSQVASMYEIYFGNNVNAVQSSSRRMILCMSFLSLFCTQLYFIFYGPEIFLQKCLFEA